jgi:hypothetical protein
VGKDGEVKEHNFRSKPQTLGVGGGLDELMPTRGRGTTQ